MANSAYKSSTFSVTCSLLSQFMKEKGRSLGELGLGINPNLGKSDTYRPTTTMSLLPGVDVSGDAPADTKSLELFPQLAADANREKEKAQLTIFYGGKVLVFDNFPADKADDLMQVAGKKITTSHNVSSAAVSVKVEPETVISAPTVSPVTITSQPQKPTMVSNLPIARKASLHRFLEKRKDRINARAPYQANKDSPIDSAKAEENQPWLGLKPMNAT